MIRVVNGEHIHFCDVCHKEMGDGETFWHSFPREGEEENYEANLGDWGPLETGFIVCGRHQPNYNDGWWQTDINDAIEKEQEYQQYHYGIRTAVMPLENHLGIILRLVNEAIVAKTRKESLRKLLELLAVAKTTAEKYGIAEREA